MGGGGAVVAIAAAAKQKRQREVLDAFRLGDATAPDRARRLEEIGVVHLGEAEALLAAGVLAHGRRDGTYYLSEAGYIAHRDQRMSAKKGVVIAIAVLLIVLGIALIGNIARQ